MRLTRTLMAGGILAAVLAGIVLAQTYDAGTELALVEKLTKARDDYKATLSELYNYYLRTGDAAMADRADKELRGMAFVGQYDYSKKTAGPMAEGPVNVQKYIPEAEDYYEDGVIFADSNRKAVQELALKRLSKVLDTWPESNKAPAAAYKMGEVYAGYYFHDYDLAGKYYQKCYELDPATTQPALLKAGDMYYKVGRTDDAVKMYKLAVEGSRDPKARDKAQAQLDKLAKMGK